jgi:nucleotide sugar dehydrogenase
MKVAVVGLGKIGLPLAVQYARKGHEVWGVDINVLTVESINRGIEPFPEEKDLQRFLEMSIKAGSLKATTQFKEAITGAEAIVVAVPVIVDKYAKPDFSAIDQASEDIARNLDDGALVCYETTLPIGTTRNRLTPLLERISGKTASRDFHVVFSPERVFTGRIFEDLRKYPKIVGGISELCTDRGVVFYNKVLEFNPRKDLDKPNGVWPVKNSETAEFIKLAETTYRDVNIGLANQFSKYADQIGVDIFEVISASNSQPFSHIHQPGISVGGHCIPVYPHFYLQGDNSATIVRAARDMNSSVPHYTIELLKSLVGDLIGRKVLVLGVSYRPNVKEAAFSGAFELRNSLLSHGAIPLFVDPFFTSEELLTLNLSPIVGEEQQIELVILHTAHEVFLNFIEEKLPNCKIVIDGRNFLSTKAVRYQVFTLGKL